MHKGYPHIGGGKVFATICTKVNRGKGFLVYVDILLITIAFLIRLGNTQTVWSRKELKELIRVIKPYERNILGW